MFKSYFLYHFNIYVSYIFGPLNKSTCFFSLTYKCYTSSVPSIDNRFRVSKKSNTITSAALLSAYQRLPLCLVNKIFFFGESAYKTRNIDRFFVVIGWSLVSARYS